MRISKISLWVSGYRSWVLVFAMSLVFLGAFPRSNVQDYGFSETTYKSTKPVILPSKGQGYPPVLAYWICGTKGDGKRILRLLKAVYHPRNQYLLQLDAGADHHERAELALAVQSENVFQAFANVNVVGKGYALNQMGSSAVAATLHAAALLLKLNTDWDWFISLSASDYPLMSQDDLLHAFTFLTSDLNFINFTVNSAWKERQKTNRIVIDPNLYSEKNGPIFYAVESRETPDAFSIFGGSPWLILTRAFMEFCVHGWDNMPRKLLMYFTNVEYPLESYFHTVLCNSLEFKNTTSGNDLSYMIWETPADEQPRVLNLSHYNEMLASGAAFARPFQEGDPVLRMVDKDVLSRLPDGLVPGHWCLSRSVNNSADSFQAEDELYSAWGNIDAVNPGPYGAKLGVSLSKLEADGRLRTRQCQTQMI